MSMWISNKKENFKMDFMNKIQSKKEEEIKLNDDF
jgi:hypothetical protein